MKLNYKFSNHCGVVYLAGQIAFTLDGNTILSPVGNRITAFDLENHKSNALPFSTTENIEMVSISPNGLFLIAVGKDGRSLLINYPKGVVLASLKFKDRVKSIKFSPDSKYFAVTLKNITQVWKTPSLIKQFTPFVLRRVHAFHKDIVTCIDWSSDGRYIITGSRDLTVRIQLALGMESSGKLKFYYNHVTTLTGHREPIVGVFFASDDRVVYSITKDGFLFVWHFISESEVEKKNLIDSMVLIESGMTVNADELKFSPKESQGEEYDTGYSHLINEHEDNNSVGSSEDDNTAKDNKEESGGDYFNDGEHEGSESESEFEDDFSEFSANEYDDLTEKDYLGRAYGHWKLWSKFSFWNENSSRVSSVGFHKDSNILVVGFYNGVFAVYDLATFTQVASSSLNHQKYFSRELAEAEENTTTPIYKLTCIQVLSISKSKINTIAINNTGEWFAFGVSMYGQLLVWEWQSERYILKQQGHFYDVNSLSYSSQGQYIVSGGKDGKLKVWNASTGFCFVTLSDHTGPITDTQYSPKGNFVVTSSLDGTVRAFDLTRYRNFRTMTSPSPMQFSTVSIDPDGEVIAAGSVDDYSICVWSIQTGKLIDVLTGHSGPICKLRFSPINPQISSASWDCTARIWELYSGNKIPVEVLTHNTQLTTLAYRPDGKQLCTATLGGQLIFWDALDCSQTSVIDGAMDINAGRLKGDLRMAINNEDSKFFTCICYSADGLCILAGGKSRYICLYQVNRGLLLRKFTFTRNRSLDGLMDYLDSRVVNVDNYETDEEDDFIERKVILPGVQSGEFSKRQKSAPRVMSNDIQFSPNNREFTIATSIGLITYSLDNRTAFDPFFLSMDVTPSSILLLLDQGSYIKSFLMALKLNEYEYLSMVFNSIPSEEVFFLVQGIYPSYIQKLCEFLCKHMESSREIELYLLWINGIFKFHGEYIGNNSVSFTPVLRGLQRCMMKMKNDLQPVSEENYFLISLIYCNVSRILIEVPDKDEDLSSQVLTDDPVQQRKRKKEKQSMEELIFTANSDASKENLIVN